MNNLDTVASITISLQANGALSISGNIGDKKLALALLDHAREAVNTQLRPEDELYIPQRDVVVTQHDNYPTKALGDML
jgi:hypothetical protein